MEEEKKNKSLIFQLYQKYKETKEAQEKAEAEKRAEEEKQKLSAEAVADASASLEAAPKQEDKEAPVDREVSGELKYLIPIYDLFTYLSGHGTDMQPVDSLSAFEERLYCYLKDKPVFSSQHKTIRHFAEEITLVCSILMSQLNPAEKKNPESEEEPPEEIPPVDAAVHVKILDNKMFAIVFVTPAQEGGKKLDVETLNAALKEQHIKYGVDQEALSRIVDDGQYMQFIVAARGTPPLNGTNGYLEDRTDCRKKKEVHLDEQGKVDFKNLDLYEGVLKDQVICELIPAVDGTPGSDICGTQLIPASVKSPQLPNGKNTLISENGLLLYAVVDGYVSYKSERYNVEPVLEIKENVDYSVGNIDFSGDVIINGDVSFGFIVKAQGTITVKGMVEGARLIAGGDIILKKGMNGNQSGSLKAAGDIRASFLENCTVHAGGCLYADSIVSCDVFCDGEVHLEGNRGIIIGGTVTVLKSVEARLIGSKSQRETTIILGETPGMVAKKNETKASLEDTRKVLEKLRMNISYLDKLRGSLPPEKLSILTQLLDQEVLYERKKEELEKTMLELIQATADYSQCYVNSHMIFPATRIEIGDNAVNIDSVLSKCHIYLRDDEVKIGTI